MRVASCSPVVLNWLFAQRRGQPPPSPFTVEITGVDGSPPSLTGAPAIDLAGTASATVGEITNVTWAVRANQAKGIANTTTASGSLSGGKANRSFSISSIEEMFSRPSAPAIPDRSLT